MSCCESPLLVSFNDGKRCVNCGRMDDTGTGAKDACCDDPYITFDQVCNNCGKVSAEIVLHDDLYNDFVDASKARVSLYGGCGVIRGLVASKWNMEQMKTRDKIARQIDTLLDTFDFQKNIKDIAMVIYDNIEVTGQGMWRGKKMETIAAAVLYYALRETPNPRTVTEVSQMVSDSQKKLTSVIKFIRMRLKKKADVVRVDPESMVNRFVSAIGLQRPVGVRAKHIISQNIEGTCISVNTLVASSILKASKEMGVSVDVSLLGRVSGLNAKTVENACDNFLKS